MTHLEVLAEAYTTVGVHFTWSCYVSRYDDPNDEDGSTEVDCIAMYVPQMRECFNMPGEFEVVNDLFVHEFDLDGGLIYTGELESKERPRDLQSYYAAQAAKVG